MGPIEQKAFDSLKSSLMEQTTLSFVPQRSIRIYVTSNVPGGLCAVLCQHDDEGQWKMCHIYVAKPAITDVETRYEQTRS